MSTECSEISNDIRPYASGHMMRDAAEQSSDEKNATSFRAAQVALIADDDEFFRMALRVILTEQMGFSEVVEATSLDDAIDHLFKRNDISLALFDLRMDGMKSAANLRVVREAYKSLKIAVVSGSRRRSDILMAITNGVHGYIPKSEGAENIKRALTLVLDGLIYIPQSITEIHSDEATEPNPAQPTLDSLSPRQREVLDLIIQGKSNKEIARDLNLGEGTVKVHMSALFRGLGTSCRSATAAVGAKLMSA